MDEDLIAEDWIVQRNNGVREITAVGVSRNGGLVITGLSKELAFHICDLHNNKK